MKDTALIAELLRTLANWLDGKRLNNPMDLSPVERQPFAYQDGPLPINDPMAQFIAGIGRS